MRPDGGTHASAAGRRHPWIRGRTLKSNTRQPQDHYYLRGIVDGKVLHWWDETLSDQLTIGGWSFPPDKLRLQSGHLGFERPV